VLPNCPDDELLDELSVIVSTGWDLPARQNRERDVRHLLLMADAADGRSYRQAAQRLLLLLDDALRNADEDELVEADRTGCRILLGVHPTYRSVASPTRRRHDAADFLVAGWHEDPPRDPAGAFQRRHQRGALRQVLECLRRQYGQDAAADDDYDVARVRRWYFVEANRQVTDYGEFGEYRIRRDGLESMELLEAEVDPQGLESSDFSVAALGPEQSAVLERIEASRTRPGYRRIVLRLQRRYEAGEIVPVAWRERLRFSPEPPDWGRYWAHVSALNDSFELEMTVTFSGDGQLPDLCWWFSAEPITDLGEIGPDTLDHLVDLTTTRSASHVWPPSETERRRQYGFIWVWLDDDDARERWEEARGQLLAK
jgi:hypothetical protein